MIGWKFVLVILSSQKAYLRSHYVGENGGLEKLPKLCEVIESGGYGARIQTQVFFLPKMIFFFQHHAVFTLTFLNH